MRQWAEDELVIPDGGPYPGRFRPGRQPLSAIWLDLLDSGRYPRQWFTGPSQIGKTVNASVIPTLYHLFERKERVIYGIPDLNMVRDKWKDDLLPAIEASRYRDLLPTSGAGARGGTQLSLRFRNGAELRFMTGGGGDKSRAGKTSRVLVITEADGFDVSSETSREASKLEQLEARTRAFGQRRRIYCEGTVTIEEGRTWQEYLKGTATRLYVPCPLCGTWVSPEREDLHGWREADNEQQARESAYFACPTCGGKWTEDQRVAAVRRSVPVHRGQAVDDAGQVVGEHPPTTTLSYRVSAFSNLFLSTSDYGAEEWKASRERDRVNAETRQRQFVWCLPVEPVTTIVNPIDRWGLMGRIAETPKNIVPAWCNVITMAMDVHKRHITWQAIAWKSHGADSVVIAYGDAPTPWQAMPEEAAILSTLRELRDTVCATGWIDTTGRSRYPDQVWVDAGYQADRVVYQFIRESDQDRYRPILGRGVLDGVRTPNYVSPSKTGGAVKFIGEDFHLTWVPEQQVLRVDIDANAWKSFLSARITCKVDDPGAMLLYRDLPAHHEEFADQYTAEEFRTEFIEGKGEAGQWVRVRRANHYWDTGYIACTAAHLCGVRLLGVTQSAGDTAVAVVETAVHGSFWNRE